jgi:hypothetical protein
VISSVESPPPRGFRKPASGALDNLLQSRYVGSPTASPVDGRRRPRDGHLLHYSNDKLRAISSCPSSRTSACPIDSLTACIWLKLYHKSGRVPILPPLASSYAPNALSLTPIGGGCPGSVSMSSPVTHDPISVTKPTSPTPTSIALKQTTPRHGHDGGANNLLVTQDPEVKSSITVWQGGFLFRQTGPALRTVHSDASLDLLTDFSAPQRGRGISASSASDRRCEREREGAGLSGLACDLRIASAQASFGVATLPMPASSPTASSVAPPRRWPWRGHGLLLIVYPCQPALAIGLVHRVV